ncbi:MAG: hypothetical protein AAFS00_14640 [Bacteroidota bacterium]
MKEEREHDDDILQELEGSPLLKSLKGNPEFDAPAGYFDRFQDQFKDLLDDDEELAAAVDDKLRNLFRAFFNLAEFQLI